MPAGRPSLYDPAYCEKVREWGSKGKSRDWIAAELGVVRMTLTNWEKEFPEFLDAMEHAKLLSQQWWEDAGQSGMVGKSIDGAIWSRSMAARFPDAWREKQTTEVTGKDGAPVQLAGKLTIEFVKPSADVVEPYDGEPFGDPGQ